MAQIEITIRGDEEELKALTASARKRVLGERAAEVAKELVPFPPPPPFPVGRTEGWSGTYTEENIAAAFRRWAAEHDGLAPTQVDWSSSRDLEHRWPRAEAVKEAAHRIADEYGIRTRRWAPHAEEARERYLLVEAGHQMRRDRKDDFGMADTPYCHECRHGSGCAPAEMSPWRFAVEMLGGLVVRNGGEQHATRSRRSEHGRTRRMVTAGRADVHVSPSDPAASRIIETLDP